MRPVWLAVLMLVIGCASPPKKPSPYRYTTKTPALAPGAHRKEPL